MSTLGDTAQILQRIFCIIVLSNMVRSSVLNVPRNSVVVFGNRMELQCTINTIGLNGSESVALLFTSFRTSEEINIYLGKDIVSSMKHRYKMERTISGQQNLIIDSVDFDHAGSYRCVTVVQQAEATTHLTVLGSNPECSKNATSADGAVVEYSFLWMWCRIEYAGNMVPYFKWIRDNAQIDIATPLETATDSNTVPLTATSAIVMQMTSDDNGVIFKCRITFHYPNESVRNAVYVVGNAWSYVADIQYGPRNLTIVRHEDRLQCAADGNPSPVYRWMNFEAGESSDGQVHLLNYTLQSDMYYTIECEATNALATERRNISVYTVYISYLQVPDDTMNPSTISLVVALVTLAVLLGVGVAIAAKANRRGRTVHRA